MRLSHQASPALTLVLVALVLPAPSVAAQQVECYSGSITVTGSADVVPAPGVELCGGVVVVADGATVTLPDVTLVEVQGSGNHVTGYGDGFWRMEIVGDDTVVRARRITGLYVTGDGHDVEATWGAYAGLKGDGNRLRYDELRGLQVWGDKNDVVTSASRSARLQGHQNRSVHRTLKFLSLTGNRNFVKVRQGRTTVSQRGRNNTVLVRRR